MNLIFEPIQRARFKIENGSHYYNAIIILQEGQYSLTIQEKQQIITPNDICIFHKDVPFHRSVLHPLTGLLIKVDEFPIALPDGLLEVTDPSRTENTIGHLFQAIQREDDILSEHLVYDLLLMHAHRFSATVTDTLVTRCLAYLQKNYSKHVTLDMLSAEFSISKQAILRKFRKHYTKTPSEYLSSIRITESKRLLKDTDLPVGEIAQQCGYDNIYYFSNCFKRAVGMSPTQYRNFVDL